MAEHKARIVWNRTGPDFLKGRYSREHTWEFDGGVCVAASPSPSVVPQPYSNPDHVDPEEAFVATISSCHMLTFLHVASKAGYHIESYEDNAVGILSKNENGIPWVSQVTLNPVIVYGGNTQPGTAELQQLHHDAHEQCFIANSVRTKILVAERE